MEREEMAKALDLLFENFWIIRDEMPDEYRFLRRHQEALAKELRQRFGMSLFIRPQFIQLLKRPHNLAPWMGEVGFSETLDYVLFCCGMAFVEDREAGSPFMMDELIREMELMVPEKTALDWTNYLHRRSIVKVLKKMISLHVIENVQGQTELFEQSEDNQEVLFVITAQARYFLARAPQSYLEYPKFEDFWKDINASSALENNQIVYQRLMMEPQIQRNEENEDFFSRLRNYFRYISDFTDNQTSYQFELYKDYGSFTLEQRDAAKEIFPSRLVVDEILVQLATLVRGENKTKDAYGVIQFSLEEWQKLIEKLKDQYHNFWSKEFRELSMKELSHRLQSRGEDWEMLKISNELVSVYPVFSRVIGEMRKENE